MVEGGGTGGDVLGGDAHRLEEGHLMGVGATGHPPGKQVGHGPIGAPSGLKEVTGLGGGGLEVVDEHTSMTHHVGGDLAHLRGEGAHGVDVGAGVYR